jgi:hypothetical protein
MKPEGCAIWNGPVWVRRAHRTICSKELGSPHIAGSVTLLDHWPLQKNKTDFSERGDWLLIHDAISDRIAPLLEEAKSKAFQFAINELCSEVSESLNQHYGVRVREKRGKGDSHGTRKPTGEASPRRNAAKIDRNATGSVDDRASRHSSRPYTIHPVDIKEDQIGRFFPETNSIHINTRCPLVHQVIEDGNRLAMLNLAIGIISIKSMREQVLAQDALERFYEFACGIQIGKEEHNATAQ